MVPFAFPAAELGEIPSHLTADQVIREIAARTAALTVLRQLEGVAGEARRMTSEPGVVRS